MNDGVRHRFLGIPRHHLKRRLMDSGVNVKGQFTGLLYPYGFLVTLVYTDTINDVEALQQLV